VEFSVGARHAVPGERTWRLSSYLLRLRSRIQGERWYRSARWMAHGCFWGVRARHAVPLLGKCVNATKNDVATCAKQWRSRCGVALAQARMPVLLNC
jgi:hypothetical protein